MPTYLATDRYATVVRGPRGEEVRYELVPGEPVEVAREHIGDLVRAGAPVDWDRVLTAAEAQAAKAKREAAEAEKAAREAEGKRVLRQWVEGHDGHPRCPGSPGATVHHGDKPHDAPADPLDDTGRSGLHVRWREQSDHINGGWWIVACWWHAPAWERHAFPPPQPPTVDRQVRHYRVARRYSSIIGSPHDLARDPDTRLIVHDGTGRVRWAEGDIVQLPGWLAQQVQRDGAGVLQLLGHDGKSVEPAAPSTEDTEVKATEETTETETAETVSADETETPRKTRRGAKD